MSLPEEKLSIVDLPLIVALSQWQGPKCNRYSIKTLTFRLFIEGLLEANEDDDHGKNGHFYSRGIPTPDENGEYCRNDISLESAKLLVLDLDVCESSPEEVHQIVTGLGYNHGIHTTHSHYVKGNTNRMRVILQCKISKKANCAATTRALFDEMAAAGLKAEYAHESKNWSQPWYLPVLNKDSTKEYYFASYMDGVEFQEVMELIDFQESAAKPGSTLSKPEPKTILRHNNDIVNGDHFNAPMAYYYRAVENNEMERAVAIATITSLLNVSKANDPEHHNHEAWKILIDGDVERQMLRATPDVKQPIEFTESFLFKSDPIPDNILPETILRASEEIGDWTSAGKEPAALSAIGAISALLNKNVNIHVIDNDLVVHSTIGQLLGSSSGGRKTTIYEKMNKPFFDYAKEVENKWDKHSAERSVQKKALTDLLKKENKKLIGGRDEHKTAKEIISESGVAIEIQRQLDEVQDIKPTLFVGDITESKLIRKIWENNNILAVFSDDARNFIKNLLGRNSNDGDSDEGIYIAGITNGDYPYNRVGQNNQAIDIMLHSISLNLLLYVQIDGIIKILESNMYRISGLAARLPIYIHPIDGVAMLRNMNRQKINQEMMRPYYDALERLCVKPDKPIDVRLTSEAGEAFSVFANQMADMIDKGGEWEGEYEVMNKITTTACIYATIFMAIEHPEFYGEKNHVISEEYFWKGANYARFISGQSIKAQKHLEYKFTLRGVPTVLAYIRREIEKKSAKGWHDGFKNDSKFKNAHSTTHRKSMNVILDYLVDTYWLLKSGDTYRLNVEGIKKGVIKHGK